MAIKKDFHLHNSRCLTQIDKCVPNMSVSIRSINNEWRRTGNLPANLRKVRTVDAVSAPPGNMELDTRECLDLIDAQNIQNEAKRQVEYIKNMSKKSNKESVAPSDGVNSTDNKTE